MKVILLKDIPRIGKKDQVKDVADGFAQNSLLPKGLAKIATQKELDALALRLEGVQKKQKEEIESIKKTIELLKSKKIQVQLSSNDKGHLFSKFKIEQLKKVFKDQKIDMDIKYIVPFEFKEVGVHIIKIKTPQVQDTFEVEIKG
jgi:large subunit ribosomal protein L9